jgi:hypothetical protein
MIYGMVNKNFHRIKPRLPLHLPKCRATHSKLSLYVPPYWAVEPKLISAEGYWRFRLLGLSRRPAITRCGLPRQRVSLQRLVRIQI